MTAQPGLANSSSAPPSWLCSHRWPSSCGLTRPLRPLSDPDRTRSTSTRSRSTSTSAVSTPTTTCTTTSLCNPGDIATRRHVARRPRRPPAVDPDADSFYDDERDVIFHASYPDVVDRRNGTSGSTNFADGNAQLKLFVTCIRGTRRADHTATRTTSLSAANDLPAPGAHDRLAAVEPRRRVLPAGHRAGFPGLQRRWATGWSRSSAAGRPSDFNGWQWAFKVTGPAHINVYLSCLSEKVSTYGAAHPSWHTHKLQTSFVPGYGGHPFDLSVHGDKSEKQLSCDSTTRSTTTTRAGSARSGSTTRTTSGTSAWTRGRRPGRTASTGTATDPTTATWDSCASVPGRRSS